MTLECGRSGETLGVEKAVELVEALLHQHHLPERPTRELRVYQTVARLRVRSEARFAIATLGQIPPDLDLVISSAIDEMNFSPASEPRLLAKYRSPFADAIQVDEIQEEARLDPDPLKIVGEEIYLGSEYVPSMFTLDETVVRQDCLGYLMREVPIARRG